MHEKREECRRQFQGSEAPGGGRAAEKDAVGSQLPETRAVPPWWPVEPLAGANAGNWMNTERT